VESILGREQRPDEKLLAISLRIDAFKLYDEAHAQRVAAIADALATAFNLASRDLFLLDQAALVQNIGELQMNRHYISAARELTANERIDLQRHPVIGEQEAAKLDLPRGAQLIVRWHHEWWNGSGYPDRLEGEQIPLAARILRAADTYAALTSTRPYRRAKSADEARRFVTEWAGIEFDPEVARALLNIRLPEVHKPAREQGRYTGLEDVTTSSVDAVPDAFSTLAK
jgi:HD-GYP domain-containing protein (c-di-GMP phosphodiesterase class II)